jgi:hypothetical protein
MKVKTYAFLGAILLLFCQIYSDNQFGYISYSTTNIGDDIQALAAKRFLPENAIPIDRDYMCGFQNNSEVKTLMNGWYIHTSDAWLREGVAPQKSWPPSAVINPMITSIHLTGSCFSTVLSEKGIEYLKCHGPIGARDFFTLHELQKRNIPSYFSGCLTLTLENLYKTRGDTIYAVDLDEEMVNYIRSKTKSKVVAVEHGFFFQNMKNESRLKYAETILNKYRKAKCVISTRLHACMPCLAFETPVLMIIDIVGEGNPRYHGLAELTRHCSRAELLSGQAHYNWDNPPENPKDYIPIRENLIRTVQAWVESNSR